MKPKLLLCLAVVLSGGFLIDSSQAAIIYPKAPEGGKQIVAKFLDPKLVKPLGITNVNDLTIADPYQSYSFDVASGERLSAAKPGVGGGWQYLLVQGTNAVGVAFVTADEKTGKALKCIELAGSGFSDGTLEALRIAEQLPQVKKQDYELRFLDMPWLVFRAVWLHGKPDEIIIPLPDRWKRWNGNQPYSEDEIIKILKPEAERGVAMWKKLDEQQHKMYEAFGQAMMDYEKAHGGKCGIITYYGIGRIKTVEPDVWICDLKGKSSECGILAYRAKVTFMDKTYKAVKRIEILEKIADKEP